MNEIDISSWLNSVTNMPEVWQTIISEALTNRHGTFTYHYENTRTKKDNEDKVIYTKPYTIDLKITIDTLGYGKEAEAEELIEKYNHETKQLKTIQAVVKEVSELLQNNDITVMEAFRRSLNQIEED